ncbi:MAG: choice-of-anchor D domain-containing protein [Deltaproteobacteria bacterium]|nr:choice-of-anchor D domain-containing protein [Deltaproteobacteria bacterium]
MVKKLFNLVKIGVSLALVSACGGGGSGQLLYDPMPNGILSISGGPVFNFGNRLLESETVREFTVTNIGSGSALEITGSFYFSLAFSYLGGQYPGQGGTCGSSLAPNSSCTVVVRFKPKSMGETQTTLQLNYHNGTTLVVTSNPILLGSGI